MKKSTLTIQGFLSLVFVLPFVAAQTVLEQTATPIADFLRSIYLTPDVLSKILLGVLLWIVLYSIVSKLKLAGGWRLGAGLISLIMVVITFIYLPQGFLEAIVLQYGAMGATILTVIPFVIVLYFSLTTENLFIARVTWVFYIVYYLAIFLYKIATVTKFAESIPYIGAIIAGLIVFFVLPGIRKLIFKGKVEELAEKGTKAAETRKALIKAEKESLEAFGGEQ